VHELAAGLTGGNHALAVEIAAVPLRIRGYGPVKAGSIAAAKAREAELRAAFRAAI
jgi:indolepyruvate ferredoxin oxidoreductase